MFLLAPMKNQASAAEERRKTKPTEGAQKLLLLFYAFFAAFGEKRGVFRCVMSEVKGDVRNRNSIDSRHDRL